ncbi:hypothetical protein [Oleiharenicola lentus]|uniref:hypothetical protein n=1 Tax=Oleiharenicola lentus TaxID=2508720 RepID=UPI003F68132A
MNAQLAFGYGLLLGALVVGVCWIVTIRSHIEAEEMRRALSVKTSPAPTHPTLAKHQASEIRVVAHVATPAKKTEPARCSPAKLRWLIHSSGMVHAKFVFEGSAYALMIKLQSCDSLLWQREKIALPKEDVIESRLLSLVGHRKLISVEVIGTVPGKDIHLFRITRTE